MNTEPTPTVYHRIASALLCLVGVATLGGALACRARSGHADRHDVRFVLNWCELGDERVEEVVESYQSARNITGDHLDAYAISISHVDEEELLAAADPGWTRGDELEGVLDDAVSFAGLWPAEDRIPWFPDESELRSDEFYVHPWSISYHGLHVDAVKLIFVRPRDSMVFYISAAM
jgi:hypothetical protein